MKGFRNFYPKDEKIILNQINTIATQWVTMLPYSGSLLEMSIKSALQSSTEQVIGNAIILIDNITIPGTTLAIRQLIRHVLC